MWDLTELMLSEASRAMLKLSRPRVIKATISASRGVSSVGPRGRVGRFGRVPYSTTTCPRWIASSAATRFAAGRFLARQPLAPLASAKSTRSGRGFQV